MANTDNTNTDNANTGNTDDAAARYARVADEFGRVVVAAAAIGPNAWSQPTPCAGWQAGDVVAHLLDWVPSVLDRSGVVQFDASPPPEAQPNDLPARWARFDATLRTALADPAISRHRFDVGPPGEMSVADAIDALVTGDVLIHTWDLARAVGVTAELDPIVVARMLAGLEPLDEVLRSSGHFGPRVDVAAESSAEDRLLAFCGRHPRWGE